jgi:hypothetical protein
MNLQEFADSVTEFNELNTSNLVLVCNTTQSETVETHVNAGNGSLCIRFKALTDGNSFLHAYMLTEDIYSYGLLTYPDIAMIDVVNFSDIQNLFPTEPEE